MNKRLAFLAIGMFMASHGMEKDDSDKVAYVISQEGGYVLLCFNFEGTLLAPPYRTLRPMHTYNQIVDKSAPPPKVDTIDFVCKPDGYDAYFVDKNGYTIVHQHCSNNTIYKTNLIGVGLNIPLVDFSSKDCIEEFEEHAPEVDLSRATWRVTYDTEDASWGAEMVRQLRERECLKRGLFLDLLY